MTAATLNGKDSKSLRNTQPQTTSLHQQRRKVRRGAKFAGQGFCFHEGSLAGFADNDKPQLSALA